MTTLRLGLFIRRAGLVASVALLASLPAVLSRAADKLSGEDIHAASMGVVASGAVEDTLKACLARIPIDASAGQRMMAELSCDRDEDSRRSIQAVPGR